MLGLLELLKSGYHAWVLELTTLVPVTDKQSRYSKHIDGNIIGGKTI